MWASQTSESVLAVLGILLSALLLALMWLASLQHVKQHVKSPRRRRALLVIPPQNGDQIMDWIAVFVLISPFVLVIAWIGDLFGS
jgi:hypothetical protein